MAELTKTSEKPASGGCALLVAAFLKVIGGLFALLLIVGLILALFLKDTVVELLRSGERMVEKVVSGPERAANAFKEIFKAEVTVSNSTLTVSPKEIRELTVFEQDLVVVSQYRRSFLGQTATVVVRGVFTAKAGYDLSKIGGIELDMVGNVKPGSLPKAEILSLETKSQEIYLKTGNFLNGVNAEDTAAAYQANLSQAREEAAKSKVLETTDRLFQRHLDSLIEIQRLLSPPAPDPNTQSFPPLP